MIYVFWALTAIASYILGCFNGAIVISKYVLKNDIRRYGSGNAGLTNFYRTFGGPWTLAVILGDVVKMVIAVLLSESVMEPFGYGMEGAYWATFFVMLGHVFPVFFHFHGGKGVLSAGTAAAIIDWRMFAVVMGLFLLAVLLTRWVSLGSILAGFAFPFTTWLIAGGSLFCIILATMCGILLIFMHRSNIVRLVHGEERRFQLSKK